MTIALMQHIISESARKKLLPLRAAPSLTQRNEPVVSGQSEPMGVEVAPVRSMRAGLAKKLAGIAVDDEASAQLECHPMDLLQVIDMTEAY